MPKKQIASSLKNLDKDKLIILASDLTSHPKDVYEKASKLWDFDLLSRKPGAAYKENGEYVGTDLDLIVFLHQLMKRNAHVKIPFYKSGTRKSVTEGQMRVKSEGIHGDITGLIANKDFLSFSVRLMDESVKNEDGTVGAFRNYSITNYSGKMSKQWKSIEFKPTVEETNFIKEMMIATGSNIPFKNFVSPARWGNLYSASYFKTVYVMDQLTKYASQLNKQIKNLIAAGVEYPDSGSGKVDDRQSFYESTAKLKSIPISCIEVQTDLPIKPVGEYPVIKATSTALKDATDLRRLIVYTWIPHLRFMIRATELSFKNILDNRKGVEPKPSWIKNAEWERDYKQKGKRIKWNRLVLDQLQVGQVGVSLRYRIFDKKKQVKEDYDY